MTIWTNNRTLKKTLISRQPHPLAKLIKQQQKKANIPLFLIKLLCHRLTPTQPPPPWPSSPSPPFCTRKKTIQSISSLEIISLASKLRSLIGHNNNNRRHNPHGPINCQIFIHIRDPEPNKMLKSGFFKRQLAIVKTKESYKCSKRSQKNFIPTKKKQKNLLRKSIFTFAHAFMCVSECKFVKFCSQKFLFSVFLKELFLLKKTFLQ